jgi:glucose uptake protein
MYIVENYFTAVLLCIVTMLCWGSWANTQKMASKKWPFQLFYRDYVIGVFIFSILWALTFGSIGEDGQGFIENLLQTNLRFLFFAFLGGVIFNLANLLLVAAIDKVGLAIAFPVAIGISTSLGTTINHFARPEGTNTWLLFSGILFFLFAVIINSITYKKLHGTNQNVSYKGIGISVASGLLMGCFYYAVATSISGDYVIIQPGKLTPYTAVVIFSFGVLLSDFFWNSNLMANLKLWDKVDYKQYFKGKPRWHLIGIVGGIIWSIGMGTSIISGGKAGYAISFGLGNGATMVAALWGVFVWKEFKDASKVTWRLLAAMFFFFIFAIVFIILSKS